MRRTWLLCGPSAWSAWSNVGTVRGGGEKEVWTSKRSEFLGSPLPMAKPGEAPALGRGIIAVCGGSKYSVVCLELPSSRPSSLGLRLIVDLENPEGLCEGGKIRLRP